MQKPWFKSKTVLVAIAQGVLGVVVALDTTNPGIGGLLIVKSLLDIFIRFETITPIDLNK